MAFIACPLSTHNSRSADHRTQNVCSLSLWFRANDRNGSKADIALADFQRANGIVTSLLPSSGGVSIDAQMDGVNLPLGQTAGANSRKPFSSGLNPNRRAIDNA
jgi:hypothetical protein